LKEVYAVLSTLIHDGTDDAEILDAMIQKVDRHFRLLDLIPIPQPS
jgi:glyceraldehyde-3-phosphate dehydrogenase/erythrose-4-phosphate dehydrogenase